MKRFANSLRFVVALILVFGLYLPLFASADSDTEPLENPHDHIVILQLQTESSVSAVSEFVLLYNPTDLDINVTNWCLMYTSASGKTTSEISCVKAQDDKTALWLEAGGLVSFGTTQFIAENAGFVADFALVSGLNSKEGHVYLVDASKNEIDRVGWGGATLPETATTKAHDAGEVLSRRLNSNPIDSDDNSQDFESAPILQLIESGIYESEIIVDACVNIEGLQIEVPDGYMVADAGNCFVDVCPNIEGLQLDIPEGHEKALGAALCTPIQLQNAVIFITEILPNAPSVDTGQEFIELYNPNSFEVDLTGYSLQVGPNFAKKFSFQGQTIGAKSYALFSDTETKITLPNSNGVALRLYAAAGNLVSESELYSEAADDVSWALVGGQWIYTNQITPGSANKPYLEQAVDEVLGVSSVLAPCPVGKFRNPATNRCKSSETAVSQLVPCDENEFRNPETNRCKKISSDSSLAACDEGQERNPETNRCRKISSLALGVDGLPLVSDIPVETTTGSHNWTTMLAALMATGGYMLFEWRSELGHSYGRLRRKLVQ